MTLQTQLQSGDFESALQRHVIDVWFPRSIDSQHGGFLCDFDQRWNTCGPNDKLLEFQARHTLFAADASRAFPGDDRLREATLHGFRYLRGALWDRELGGWFHMLDRAGRPKEAETKHVHGTAYAISACVSVHQTTGSPESLQLAQEGFNWLEQYAHDPDHGGYVGFMNRDGSVIGRSPDPLAKVAVDTVGTEVGFKDLNVHSDLLETLAALYRVWPDATVGDRLRELLEILTDKMYSPGTGALHFYMTPDWKPIPHLVRAGYQSHTAFRILWALEVLGPSEAHRCVATRLIDHALRYLIDPEYGGFFYAAPGAIPNELFGFDLRVPHKAWWVQVEVLKALLALGRLGGEHERFIAPWEAQWRYIKRNLLDEQYGGLYSAGFDMVPRWRRAFGSRYAPATITRKGDVWKDASHEGRALLYCIETLRAGRE